MLKFSLKSPAVAGFLIFNMIVGCSFNSQRIGALPVIKVNEHTLSAKEFSNKLARKLKNFDALAAKDPNNIARTKDEITRDFIISSLISDFAYKNDIVVSDLDVDKEINKFRSSYPDDLSFRRALVQENLSLAEWKDELRLTLIQKAVFKKISEKNPPPTDADLMSFYEQNKDKFKRKERVLLRQIVLDELAKAEAVKNELKSADFITMAKKYSVSPEAKSGGLVGWIERGAVDIFDKAFSLGVGSVGPILESAYGFHIFKVEKKEGPSTAPFSEVKDIVIQSVTGKREQAEFSSWLDKQLRLSKVYKNNDLIENISVETRE